MKALLRRLILLTLLAAGALAMTGCQATPQDSSVPWSRPAEWEGQLPGLGQP